jgi:type I restriction enzyme S subunit
VSSKKNKAAYSPLGALVSKIEGGGTPSKEVPGFWDGDIPLLTIKDLPNARLGVTVDRITAKGLESSSSKIVPAGIPVIATRMDVGRVVRCPVPVAINQDLRAIYPNPDKVDVDYIVQVLPTLEREFRRYSCGSTVMGIGIDDLKSIKIYLPTLAEQRKIAEILRTWDEAIETVEAEISRLKERLVSLIAKLTLRQCVGKPEQGWHDVKIGDLLEEVDRDVEWDDAKTFSLISCGRRASGIFLRERKSGSDIDVKKMYEVQAGDFIVSQKQSAHAGWGMVTKEFHGHHVSPMYTIYGLKGKDLHMPYFNWLCKTPWMRHQAYLSSYGVHIEKMSFVSRLFLKTKIRIPSLLTDQEKACAILESAESEIKAATFKLEKLNEQKRGLMQKLLTGEVRVVA